jgi:diguanylate cyclase (GGDEF)-like protein
MTTGVVIVVLHLAAFALVIALIAVLRRRRELERKLVVADNAAHTDHLTGLANRAGLQRRMAAQRNASDGGAVSALILINIDGLRSINERHGHEVGDAVIVEVGRRLARPRARVVCCARLGGDDFAVLLETQSNPTRASQDAEQVAYGLCAAISEPMVAAEVSVDVTASAGVATLPSSQVGRLLTAADMALYRAKTKGLAISRYQPMVDGPADPRQRPRVRLRDLRNQGDGPGNDVRRTMRSSAREWIERPEVS